MPKLTPVTNSVVQNDNRGRPSTVSKPLIDEFLATGANVAEIDPEGQPIRTLYVALYNYVKSHELPIKVRLLTPIIRLEKIDTSDD